MNKKKLNTIFITSLFLRRSRIPQGQSSGSTRSVDLGPPDRLSGPGTSTPPQWTWDLHTTSVDLGPPDRLSGPGTSTYQSQSQSL